MAYTPQPPFHIQLTDADGRVIKTRAGGKHEADLVETFVRHIASKGVGLFRTEAHVLADVRAGIIDALMELKVKDPFDVVP